MPKKKQVSYEKKFTKRELLDDIGELVFYIMQVTGSDYESCAVYDICKKYE